MDPDSSSSKEALLSFMTDINCLDKLLPWIDDINIFSVLKLKRVEIRHSNMLAWLLDPNENHGLGCSFLYGFLSKLPSLLPEQEEGSMLSIDFLSLLSSDLGSFQIKREWNSIDVLIVSNDLKVVIAVENKIDSGLGRRKTGKTQLDDYDDVLRREYLGWQWARILLAPDQSRFGEDFLHWGRMEYSDVSEVLNRCFEKHKLYLKPEACLIITNYLRILKNEINMDDPELTRICNDIYKKHKLALDLIFKVHESPTAPIAEICDEWISQLETCGFVVQEPLRSKSSWKFRSKKLLDHFSVNDDLHKHFYYEIRIFLSRDGSSAGVKMALVFYKDPNGFPNEMMEEKMKQIMPTLSFSQWKTVESKIKYFDLLDIKSETIKGYLDRSLKELDARIPPTSASEN